MGYYFTADGVGSLSTGDKMNSAVVSTDETSQTVSGFYDTDSGTIFFLSDTAGTLTVLTEEPDGEYKTYDTYSISADTLKAVNLTDDHTGIKIKFSTSAKTTAWYSLNMEK